MLANSFWKAKVPNIFACGADDALEAIKFAVECEKKHNPYAQKLTEVFLKEQELQSEKLARDMLDKKFKKDMKKIEEESKTVLWN